MKFFLRRFFCLRMLVAGSFSVLPAAAATFTMESAATHAVSHNPGLAAARAGLHEARARVDQTGGLPNPEFETEIRPNLAGREFSAGIGFSQQFPLSNRLRIEKDISLTALRLAEIEIRTAERSLASQVRMLCVQLLALQAQQKNLASQAVAAEDLAEAATKSAAVGETSLPDAAQLELESAQLSIQSLQAATEYARLTGQLQPLLGTQPDETINITGSLSAPQNPPSVPDRFENHPAWQAAVTREQSALQGIALAKASRWENLTVGVGYERSHEDDAGVGMERDNIAVIRFSLPLPFRKHNAAHITEAKADASRTSMEANSIASGLQASAAAAVGEMKALISIHRKMDQELLPKARDLEKKLADLHKNGQAPIADVLRARRQRLTMEAALLDARRDFHLARIRFETAAGR